MTQWTSKVLNHNKKDDKEMYGFQILEKRGGKYVIYWLSIESFSKVMGKWVQGTPYTIKVKWMNLRSQVEEGTL